MKNYLDSNSEKALEILNAKSGGDFAKSCKAWTETIHHLVPAEDVQQNIRMVCEHFFVGLWKVYQGSHPGLVTFKTLEEVSEILTGQVHVRDWKDATVMLTQDRVDELRRNGPLFGRFTDRNTLFAVFAEEDCMTIFLGRPYHWLSNKFVLKIKVGENYLTPVRELNYEYVIDKRSTTFIL